MNKNNKQIPCSCDNGIIDCPGCKGNNEKDRLKNTCAGCLGTTKVICGKCGGSGQQIITPIQDFIFNAIINAPVMPDIYPINEDDLAEVDDFLELTEQDKIDRANGKDDLPEGSANCDKVSLDDMIKILEKEYKYNSNIEAKCINELIRFYGKHKGYQAKEYYVIRKRNCATIGPNGLDTDIIGITTDENKCKEMQSVFCGYEKVKLL